MAEFTFAEIMRTGHVKRWQIVRVAREQTIAEHMYRVWLITTSICVQLKMPQQVAASANIWALIHDLPEVLTGDIATPAKEAMRRALPDDDPVRNIELSMSDNYREAHADAKTRHHEDMPTAYELVKLADLIEAKCFLGCEMMGNHAKSVYDGIAAKVDSTYADYQVRYPLVDWPAIQFLINNSWEKV